MKVPCTCALPLLYGDHDIGCPRAAAFRKAMDDYEPPEPDPREVWESTLKAAARKLKRVHGDVDGPKPIGLHFDFMLAVAEVVTAINALDELDDQDRDQQAVTDNHPASPSETRD